MNAFFSRLGVLALCVCLWLGSAAGLRAAGQPVTVKELCLMLRGGYTGDEVLRETAGRPLLEPIDADAEKSLRAAGADARLIASLKTTHPTLTGDQAEAARRRQADVDHRNLESWEANQARLLAANKQAFEHSFVERKQEMLDKMATNLRGQLVAYKDVSLQNYPDDALAGKKLFAFYFAALTNPQCEKFTPQLVKFYQDFAPKHPVFEVVFISEDRSAYNMENHMRQYMMPWPALAFDRKAQQPDLAALGKEVVPRLVLLDGMGRTVSDSVVAGQYVGPQHVLDDLTHLADTAANGGPAPTPPPPMFAPAANPAR